MKLPQVFFEFNFLLTLTVESYNLDTSYPLIYEIPFDSEKGSYFGLAVAIRPKASALKDTWSIQIGAPRGNVAGVSVREPGAVYRCHTFGPCREFEVGRGLTASGGLGIYEFKEKKDGAWIGVAMDIKNFGSHETTVICGHRWINRELKNPENIDVTYLMTGVCYIQDLLNGTFEFPVTRVLPLVNKEKIYTPKPYVTDLSTYHWGLGQAGFSVKFLEESSSFLIGAPGVTHWIGSVIKCDSEYEVTVGNFARTELARRSRYTYLGYSLALGRFYKDKKFWYATGAPRSANYRGEVFIFQFKGPNGDVKVESNLVGATFGEYFGSSLAAGDVNGDGFDDLIIGAPLFSGKDPDEGRIYLYLGTGRGYFLVPAQIVNGRTGKGRFGSCITFIRDLDQDGYGDVAVGAPYEDDNRGAVYIYRGFTKGLNADFSQRIHARDIHPHLRGFGISISPPVDVDGNKYLDIAIGSYLSDHVVLIKSRPVVSLHPEIKTDNVSLISRKESHMNVSVCSRYGGSNAPNQVDVVETIEVDPIYGRGILSSSKTSVLRKSIHLRQNEIICDINTIMLTLSGENFSPLQIIVKNEISPCKNEKSSFLIKEEKTEKPDGFPPTCLIGIKAETLKEIPFAGICGPDLICRSDLELTCDVPDFRSGFYTLGSSDRIVLLLRVKNHGEPAHNTKIKIWSNLKLHHTYSGQEAPLAASSSTFWLPVEGILTENYQTNFSFQIDLEAFKENEELTHVNFIVEIFTASLESNLQNNICKFSVKLLFDDFFEFYASSSISSMYISKETVQNQSLNVEHYYEVRKMGVTPIKDAQLTLYIPFYSKKDLVTFSTETSEWMQISDYEVQKKERSDSGDFGGEMESSLPNRTLFINCSTGETDCKVFKIFFTRGVPTEFSSYVKITLTINLTQIDLVKNKKDIIHLTTTGELKIFEFNKKEPNEFKRSASIILYSEERESGVKARTVALSVLGGGFLLSLVITGLIKSNFFERRKRKELKALKDAEASFVYFATAGSSQVWSGSTQQVSPK